jgi:hypothetical protein
MLIPQPDSCGFHQSPVSGDGAVVTVALAGQTEPAAKTARAAIMATRVRTLLIGWLLDFLDICLARFAMRADCANRARSVSSGQRGVKIIHAS